MARVIKSGGRGAGNIANVPEALEQAESDNNFSLAVSCPILCNLHIEVIQVIQSGVVVTRTASAHTVWITFNDFNLLFSFQISNQTNFIVNNSFMDSMNFEYSLKNRALQKFCIRTFSGK